MTKEEQITFCMRAAQIETPAPPAPRPTWEDVKGAKKIVFRNPDSNEVYTYGHVHGWRMREVLEIEQMLADPEFTVEVIE